jgi:SAM-dependent methyltransferase
VSSAVDDQTTSSGSASPEAPWQFEHVPCDFCGATEAETLYEGFDRLHGLPGEFRVVACRQCGLARTDPRPTLDSLPAAYPDAYGPHHGKRTPSSPRGLLRWSLTNHRGYPLGHRSPNVLRYFLWPLASLALGRRRALGYLPYGGDGRLLDFGCGSGTYVARMVAAGWRAEGLDLSPEAVREGREARLTIHEGTLPGADLAESSYDAITMWHALEHVPSPTVTLRAARSLLAPGGRLLVSVPRLDSLAAGWVGSAWTGLDLPRHLTHFTAKTLRRYLEKARMHVERIHSVRRPGFLRHSYGQLADETGRASHRRLSRSRILVGLQSHIALWAGRTQQMIAIARRD